MRGTPLTNQVWQAPFSLSASVGIVPTRWVFAGRRHCCLICAHCVSHGGGGSMWGIFGKPLKRAIWKPLGLHAVLTTCLRFSSGSDGARVACCLFLSTGSSHVRIQIHSTGCCFPSAPQKPLTPDPENLQAHPGFVWVKSGYSEAIAWHKVRLTKQRKVHLTTDGLWAMPLSTTWVPVKARRLQDWGKLKTYVPIHKHGDVCPNAVPALVERRSDDDDSDSE